jgi:hypothetical protein
MLVIQLIRFQENCPDLEARNKGLTKLLGQGRASEEMIKKIPTAIKTFEDAFNSLETRQQKAHKLS